MNNRKMRYIAAFFLISICPAIAHALDTEGTRQTLKGLRGVYVIVEDLQPNMQKYSSKAGLTKDELQSDIERQLRERGIRALSRDEWMKTPGKPIFYVSVNTHETEKYWYAYDIKTELQQTVFMETNPKVKALATTWSMNMTGSANIGTLHVIRGDVGVLVGRFIKAYKAVNERK